MPISREAVSRRAYVARTPLRDARDLDGELARLLTQLERLGFSPAARELLGARGVFALAQLRVLATASPRQVRALNAAVRSNYAIET